MSRCLSKLISFACLWKKLALTYPLRAASKRIPLTRVVVEGVLGAGIISTFPVSLVLKHYLGAGWPTSLPKGGVA